MGLLTEVHELLSKLQVNLLEKLTFVAIFLLAGFLNVFLSNEEFVEISSDDFQVFIFPRFGHIVILIEP